MFPLEQGASEMLLIAAIALIVVGPKDLPVLMRKVGQFTARMRGMANEFRASFDEMARQSELDELRKEVDALRSGAYIAPGSTDGDRRDYDYDQTPAHHPSPPEPPPHPVAESGGVYPMGVEGPGLAPAPDAPVAPIPVAPAFAPDPSLDAEKSPKPRARKAAAAPPRPRKLRAPKAVADMNTEAGAPAGDEAEG